jgi:phosphoribosylglycinamide formyltransferase-1
MMKVVVLTGDETRHQFFRKFIYRDPRVEVLASYCEGVERSLQNRFQSSAEKSNLLLQHVQARAQSESDYFGMFVKDKLDNSRTNFIQKGDINQDHVVEEIINLKADLLVCYGSSLIRSNLLRAYEGRFLNVHLGLSPYYRGSGTNVWPLINGEPGMVGATFMHIDEGIDTGLIIHQIRADIYLGDSPHSIGNRLILKMTQTYAEIIANFANLQKVPQPTDKGRLYLQKDFDAQACRRLYDNFSGGLIEKYLNSPTMLVPLVQNPRLS